MCTDWEAPRGSKWPILTFADSVSQNKIKSTIKRDYFRIDIQTRATYNKCNTHVHTCGAFGGYLWRKQGLICQQSALRHVNCSSRLSALSTPDVDMAIRRHVLYTLSTEIRPRIECNALLSAPRCRPIPLRLWLMRSTFNCRCGEGGGRCRRNHCIVCALHRRYRLRTPLAWSSPSPSLGPPSPFPFGSCFPFFQRCHEFYPRAIRRALLPTTNVHIDNLCSACGNETRRI